MDRPERAETGACSWCGGDVSIADVIDEYHAGLTILGDEQHTRMGVGGRECRTCDRLRRRGKRAALRAERQAA